MALMEAPKMVSSRSETLGMCIHLSCSMANSDGPRKRMLKRVPCVGGSILVVGPLIYNLPPAERLAFESILGSKLLVVSVLVAGSGKSAAVGQWAPAFQLTIMAYIKTGTTFR